MKRRPTNQIALIIIFFLSAVLGGWVILAAQDARIAYDSLDKLNTEQSRPVTIVEIDDSRLVIPSWEIFHEGNLWSLISNERHLSKNYTPKLETTAVSHARDVTPKVNQRITKPLQSMVTAAEADGVTLVLSSAYRSAAEQVEVYEWYKQKLGESYAKTYVAAVGASEHQTGLAVDLASSSSACLADSGKCELVSNAIAWLKDNASKFGFIERYPAGKQSITGVTGEAWHYRYVGKTLAGFLAKNDLTLDEFVKQAAGQR